MVEMSHYYKERAPGYNLVFSYPEREADLRFLGVHLQEMFDGCGELASGIRHQVLKNFPTLEELKQTTEPFGEFHRYIDLKNFWLFQYVFKK
jgi:hypothetical protein